MVLFDKVVRILFFLVVLRWGFRVLKGGREGVFGERGLSFILFRLGDFKVKDG